MSNFISKAGVLQKFLHDVSYEEEVVVYASALDEGTPAAASTTDPIAAT
jgi:hypothetical protein